MVHKPVLLGAAIENLNLAPGMTVVDATLGAGGHSTEILKNILPGGKLISIDWDGAAVAEYEEYLKKKGIAVLANQEKIEAKLGNVRASRGPTPIISNAHGEIFSPLAFLPLFSGDKIVGYWCGVNENYANLHKIIKQLQIVRVSAILADLGFSSDQIENSERGFSFLRQGPLDMRYSANAERSAADIINQYPKAKLAEIFREYGEERYAARIAANIAEARKIKNIRYTRDLVEIIEKSVPRDYKLGRIHFATKIFQALRIEANWELENLKKFLPQAVETLRAEGRLAIISFHSLEDRIVKRYFQKEAKDCICPSDAIRCNCRHRKILKIITKKPIFPTRQEIRNNPRSRSAKLRIAEKI